MKKALVTGATGFIGNYVIRELLKKEYHVIATSASQEKAQLKDWYSSVSYIPFDFKTISPDANYFSLFDNPDLLIHLAWEGLPNYKEPFHITENLPRHCIFLQNLVKHGLKDVTVAGTCFEYGMQEGALSENLLPAPSNSYAMAKNRLRLFLNELQREMEFDFKWVRLFYMYGKGQNSNSLLSQLNKALDSNEPVFNMSGGKQMRDFLPIEKVAEYIAAIAMQQYINGIINCCSGIPVTVEQFVQDYLKAKGKSIQLNLGYYPYADYEPMNFWGSNEILKGILNRR